MMKVPRAPFMGLIGRLVTVEAFQVIHFAQFQGGGRLIGFGHVIFRGLEIIPVPLIVKDGGLVNYFPVGVDRDRMALFTSPGRRDCLPGSEHGTAA